MTSVERMILGDVERGVNVNAYDTVVTGPPIPRRDRTIPAAPLGWTPAGAVAPSVVDDEGTAA